MQVFTLDTPQGLICYKTTKRKHSDRNAGVRRSYEIDLTK